MKKLLVVLVVICCGIADAMAQSMLKVRLADSSQFNVSVDGHYFNRRGTSITVGDLPPGSHFLRIFALRVDRRGRGHEDAIFDGRVKTHDGMATLFVYDPNTDETNINETDMSAFPVTHPQHHYGQHFRDQYYDDNGNNSNDNNGNNNDNANNTPPTPPPAPVGTVTDNKMNDLKTSVAAQATDIDKTKLLEGELKNEKITTAQVSEIMDWFVFESSKVDFAKWAYPITVDKENYPGLENKFQYKESQDDLDGFIKGQK